MKNNLRITLFFIFVSFILFSSCKKDNPVSITESVEEKKKGISEIGTAFLPNDILDSYLDVSDLPEDKQIEYLDTLDVAVTTFRDTLLKYYSASELEQAFNRVDQASAKLNREKGFKSEAELFDYIRLGYGKSAQLSVGGESGIAWQVGVSLNSNGGGGIEVLYDFVNMDREIYTTSFCYLGGSVLIGAEIDPSSFEVGYSGINKWVLNINTREGVGKFEGAARGFSFGVSKEVQAVLGLSAGISLSRTQDVLANGNFTNASVCPSGFAFDSNPSGVKEFSFETNVDVSGGPAGGLTAAIEGGVLGIYRNVVEDSFTNFGIEENGRRIAAFKMANELILQSSVSGIMSPASPGFDLLAVVFALKYGKITYEDFESVSPSIVVAPDLINAPVTTSTHYINISNIGSGNLEWLITTEEEWIEIGEKSGSGEDKIEINVMENTTGNLRSGEITINSNGGDDQTILIQQEGSTTAGGIYSENFESDPDFTVKYSNNTEGKANIYWDDNAENYYASVMDQSDTWYSLGYSPVFGEGIDTNNTDFIISFEFNPIEPDWGHYPGIYFLESGDIESPHELQRALQFTINWSDNTYKKFKLIGFSDDDNSQFLSPRIPKENEWYTVQIIYKSDVEKIDLTIEREDGSMFVDENNLEIPLNNPFNQLAIGEIQGPIKYGSKSIIRIDNISIKEQ